MLREQEGCQISKKKKKNKNKNKKIAVKFEDKIREQGKREILKKS